MSLPVHAQGACAIFDEPVTPGGGGYASIAGQEPFRFSSISDLDPSCIWVTSLEYMELLQSAPDAPHLRRRSFFRSDLGALAWDYGLDMANTPDLAASFLAALFNRVLRMLQHNYGISTVYATLTETLHNYLVRDDDDPKLSQAYRDLIRQASHNIQQCPTRVRAGEEVIAFRWPRAGYAALMLQYPVPVGHWYEHSAVPPTDPQETYRFLCDIARRHAGVVKVSLEKPPTGYVGLVDVGMSESRSWVPLHEAAFLSRLCQLKVQRVLVSEAITIPAQHPRWRLPDLGAVSHVSASAGLIADAHWVALATSTWSTSGQRRLQRVSPRAIVMRAWDRLACLRAAYELAAGGARIVSYGGGCVSVAAHPLQRAKLVALAAAHDLVAPIGITSSMAEQDATELAGAM